MPTENEIMVDYMKVVADNGQWGQNGSEEEG